MNKLNKLTSQILILLSSIGFVDALFLTQKHYSNTEVNCAFFSGCDVVTNSVYAEIFGIPVSLLGMIYYGSIFILAAYSYLNSKNIGNILAAQLSIAGLATSFMLVYIMVYVLKAICFYCLISAVTSTLIFIFSVIYLRKQKTYFLKDFYDYLFSFNKIEYLWGLLRISLGFIFLWPFINNLPSWIAGKSPTAGFLQNATSGIFADSFANMSASPVTDYLYMFGLLLVGSALILGISMKLAMIGGSLMMLLFYLASALPPEHNPLIDEHIIYMFVLSLLYLNNAGEYLGFQKKWRKLDIVKQLPIFK